MNRKELVEEIVRTAKYNDVELDKNDVDNTLDFLATILSTTVLIEGEDISIQGFGKFKQILRAERKGRNPKTGDEIIIPAKTKVVFSLAPSLVKS